MTSVFYNNRAGVVELVDAPDSKSGSERSVGSSPTTRTTLYFSSLYLMRYSSAVKYRSHFSQSFLRALLKFTGLECTNKSLSFEIVETISAHFVDNFSCKKLRLSSFFKNGIIF